MRLFIYYEITCVILCLFIVAQFRFALSNTCINLPKRPMHGRLKVNGEFYLRIKCLEPETDLPLNAPGDGGILTCDPNDKQPTLLHKVGEPKCLNYKSPDHVFMLIRFMYLAEGCDLEYISKAIDNMKQLQILNLQSVNATCGEVLKCNVSSFEAHCSNYMISGKNQSAKQLDISFKIFAVYSHNLTTSYYLHILDDIRKKHFDTYRGLNGTSALWSIDNATLVQAHVGAWTAFCESFSMTSGTNLAIHGIASCRGCPVSTVFEPEQYICEPCPFNYYTEGPFAEKCINCPPESSWGASRNHWIDLCYVRILN